VQDPAEAKAANMLQKCFTYPSIAAEGRSMVILLRSFSASWVAME
jgi:hypothetical protein